MLAGSNTWALCVWCPRAAAPGSTKEKVEKTPLVPRDRSINQTVRNWSRSARRPRGTRSSKCSDDCRSRVRSCRRATNNSQEEIGVMNQEPSMAEQDHGARSQGRRERTLVWKPLETRPHNYVSGARGDSGADVSHRQCRHGWTQTKKQPGNGPQNPRK